MKPMTNKEYIDEDNRDKCPFCRGTNITHTLAPEITKLRQIVQLCKCSDCEEIWDEIFELIGWRGWKC